MITEIIGGLLGITEQYLSLKNTQESRKYLDQLIYIKKGLQFEKNKPDSTINHARIDNLNSKLRILVESIATLGE